jgi:DNA-binding response OmpR family regulator
MRALVNAPTVIATSDRTVKRTKSLFRNVYNVSTASGLFHLHKDIRPQLILLDMDMPNVSAEDALEKLRAARPEVVTLIVASSGEKALRAMRAGAEDYVLKPIRLGDLRTRIQVLLKQHERQQGAITPLDAPISHLVEKLHDPKNGQLNAKEVSRFFGLSLAKLSRILGRGVSTVHKTPSAPALQEALVPFEAMASGLLRLTGSEQRARMWLHSSNPALEEHAPIEWLRSGKVVDLARFIQDLLEGRPA